MSFTKAEIQEKIDLIIDNSANSITPAILRQALSYLKDMKQLDSFIAGSDGVLLSDKIADLVSQNIPAWSAKAWPSDYFVFHNGKIYKSNVAVSNVDAAPDSSVKWNSLDDLKPAPTLSSTLTTNNIDWSLETKLFTKTITGNTTLAFINTENALDKIITLVITGNYTVTWPATCRLTTSAYSGVNYPNYIRIHCVYVHPTDHSQDIFYVTITKQSGV